MTNVDGRPPDGFDADAAHRGWLAPVIEMNRDAMKQMHGEVKLEIVPLATHLFEEPGTLEAVTSSMWSAR